VTCPSGFFKFSTRKVIFVFLLKETSNARITTKKSSRANVPHQLLSLTAPSSSSPQTVRKMAKLPKTKRRPRKTRWLSSKSRGSLQKKARANLVSTSPQIKQDRVNQASSQTLNQI
jgi:hypothetical protein